MGANRRPLLIIVAAVLAAATGLFAFDYLSQPKHPQVAVPPQTVVVASRPIPARTQIDTTMLTLQTKPGDQVSPGAFSSTVALNGDVALTDIPAGGDVTASNAGPPSKLMSPVHLHNGMRAMSIPVDEIKSVSGLVQPGDRVDVYAVTPRQGSTQPDVFAIMRGVTVLAIGGSTVGLAGGPNGAALTQMRSMTLEVTPQQAKVLALADLNATLRLALRPPGEPVRTQTVDRFVLNSGSMPTTPVLAQQAAPAPQPLPAALPVTHTPNPDGVEFIYGDKIQDGTP